MGFYNASNYQAQTQSNIDIFRPSNYKLVVCCVGSVEIQMKNITRPWCNQENSHNLKKSLETFTPTL